MKIFILRHEDRTQDATFFSPLTVKGHTKANQLAHTLKDLKINKIYSSPFIRTLQTINPYIELLKNKNKNLKINIDYSLSEIQHPHIIPPKSYQITIPEYIAKNFNYNEKYNSIIEPTDFDYPENESCVKKRVKKFIMKLIDEYLSKDVNILIVTHQIVCNTILNVVSKDFKDLKFPSDFGYPTGGLTLVFNENEWEYRPINW